MKRQSPRPFLTLAAAAVIAALVGSLSSAWASHQFSDVATGTFYHDSVESIVDAGCAKGFPDGTFRTSDNATRGQFSFWVRNCGGRAASGDSPGSATVSDPTNDLATGPESTLASVALDVGGTGQQFVTLVGSANFFANNTYATYCTQTPTTVCNGHLRVYEDGTLLDEKLIRFQTDFAGGSVTVVATVPATSGTHNYSLRAASFGAQSVAVNGGSLHATTSMFGSTGGDTESGTESAPIDPNEMFGGSPG